MRTSLILVIIIMCFHLVSEGQTIPVDIGYANLDIIWDKAPLSAYKFRNGENIEIVTSHKQWFKNCDSRIPSLWIYTDEANDRLVYLYNYYAITDERKITPQGFEIPTKGLLSSLNGQPQTNFPFHTKPGKYLAVIRETKRTEIVSQPYYFWTSSLHESSLDGEEIAYIGSADENTRKLTSSTGEFCEGYPVLCLRTKPKSQYDYKLLLQSKYCDLYKDLKMSINEMDWSALKINSPSQTFWLSLEGHLSFNNAGKNNSHGFEVAIDSETKLRDIDLTPLNEKTLTWPYYPVSFGSPVPVSQTIRMDLMIEQSLSESSDTILRYNQARFYWLKDDHSKILREAMSRGRVDRIFRNTIISLPINDLACSNMDTVGVQYNLDDITFRGPSYCLFSPIGQATRLVTSHYSQNYKKVFLSGFLALSVPAMLLATGYSALEQKDLERKISNSPVTQANRTSQLASMKRDTAVLAAITGVLISVDFTLGIHYGHKNKVAKNRFVKLRHDNYPKGFSFVSLNQ